ncbi:hypothetical protein BT69DRAFT_1307923 [Atractiella rhizophila]|nr:hypothetical protein BT69DRAFT_1307923 [Atractiella rhizophila]
MINRSSLPTSIVSQLEDELLPWPALVAFDLEVDTHVYPPIKRPSPTTLNKVVDKRGYDFSLYPDVPAILSFLRSRKIMVAACSRTSAPPAARQALKELLIPVSSFEEGKAGEGMTESAISMFDQLEIYPGSKKAHFRALHEKRGVSYDDMLFFDDEYRNSEVSKLGVTFCLVDEDIGVDWATFEKGLDLWRKSRAMYGDGH